VSVDWNLLYGFPGESPEAYTQMAELVPLITHFDPPDETRLIMIGHFSPLFEKRSGYDLKVTPSPAYAFIYPFDGQTLENLASYFIYDYATPQAIEEYTYNLNTVVENWQLVHPQSHLTFKDDGEHLLIHDQRPVAVTEYHEFTGLQRNLYLACDEAQPISHLQKRVNEQTQQESSVQEVEFLLQPMLDNKLMLHEGQCFLSLAINK